MVLWLLACTGPAADDTGDSAPPDTDTTTACLHGDLPGDPGFWLAGCVGGEPFETMCPEITAVAGITRDGEQVQLTAGCRDSGSASVPTSSLTISGDEAQTYSDCGYSPGQAVIQVGSDGTFVSCPVEGARSFDVVLTTAEPVGEGGLHFVGTMHWDTGDGEIDVDAAFDVVAEG